MGLYGGINIPGCPDLDNIRRLDLMPMESIAEMMRYGFPIDRDHLRELSIKLGSEMTELRREICDYIPAEKLDEFVGRSYALEGNDRDDGDSEFAPMNVGSPAQMAKLLFDVLGIGKGKRLKMTKTGDRPSTGKRQLEQLKTDKSSHPVLKPVLAYSELAKLKSTYTDSLPNQARRHQRGDCRVCERRHEHETFNIHTTLLSTRTSTGRFASKQPNLQNIPVRSEYGRQTRSAFIAPPGMVLVSCDFSQLQLRILADRAREEKLIWIFANNKDPHTMTAMGAFGLANESDVDPLTQRAPAKNVNFAVAFGETPQGLFDQLVADSYGKSGLEVPEWLTMAWCEEFFEKWHGLYPAVRPYMEKQFYRARRYGIVWDMFGRIRRVPEVRSVHPKVVAAGLRQAGNHPIQAPDSAIMRLSMAEVQTEVIEKVRLEGIWAYPVMTVHDELIVAVDEEYGDVMCARLEQVMGNVMLDRETGEQKLAVPIVAKGHVMKRWEK